MFRIGRRSKNFFFDFHSPHTGLYYMYIVTVTYRRHFCSRGMEISTHFPAPRRSPHRTGRTPPGLTNRHGPLPPAKETMTSPISEEQEPLFRNNETFMSVMSLRILSPTFLLCVMLILFLKYLHPLRHMANWVLAFTNEWNVWYTCRLQPNLISENHVYRRNYCTWSESNQFKNVTLAVCFKNV